MPKRQYTSSDLDLIDQLCVCEAKKSFHAFRQYIHPKRIQSWFVFELDKAMQEFFEDFIGHKKPKLAISTPCQHGKSLMVIDFSAWITGKIPDNKIIFASFSDRLGVRANNAVQRIMSTEKYKKIFPDVQIGSTCNNEIITIKDREGYFRNVTAGGAVTGESLDLVCMDDIVKGRQEANSQTVRERTWDWVTDDLFTRFSEDAGLLLVSTRWHVDDPFSRLMGHLGDKLKVINYPAIATCDEPHRKEGEALFPELKSLEFLTSIKAIMAASSWLSLYQGNPTISGGEIIHTSWFQYYTVIPLLEYRMMYADTAQKTKERNDFSVLQVWGKGQDGRAYLIDQLRGKWEAPELEIQTIAFWNKHKHSHIYEQGQLRGLKIEDKASGTGLIQKIKTIVDPLIPITGIERTTDKYTRVLDILGYISSGYVYLPSDAPWLSDFLAECEAFTSDDSHLHDDQIDPMCDAINDLVSVNGEMGVWSSLGA